MVMFQLCAAHYVDVWEAFTHYHTLDLQTLYCVSYNSMALASESVLSCRLLYGFTISKTNYLPTLRAINRAPTGFTVKKKST